MLRVVCALALVGLCSGEVNVASGWTTFKGDVQHTGFVKGASLPTAVGVVASASLDVTNAKDSSAYSAALGLAYVPNSNSLTAVRVRTTGTETFGSTVWTTSHGVQATPALSEDGTTIYYGDADRTVYAADAATNAVKWHTKLSGAAVGSVVLYNDKVMVTTDTGGAQWFQILNATSGGLIMQCDAATQMNFGPAVSEADGGTAYVVSEGKELFAFNLANLGCVGMPGSCKSCANWHLDSSFGLGLPPSGPPAVDTKSGSMWIVTQPDGTFQSHLISFDLTAAEPRSTMKVAATVPGSIQVTPTPVNVDGELTVIVAANQQAMSDPNVYAYTINTTSLAATLKWKVNAYNGQILSPPICDGSTIIVPVNNYVVGLDFAHGTVLHKARIGSAIGAGVAVTEHGEVLATGLFGDFAMIGNQGAPSHSPRASNPGNSEGDAEKYLWDGWHKYASIGGGVVLLAFCGIFCSNLCCRKPKGDEDELLGVSDNHPAGDDEIHTGTYASLAHDDDV